MFFLTLIAAALAAPPSAAALQSAWNEHKASMAAHGVHPLHPEREDFVAVANGKVAKRRIAEDGPDRAMGMLWTPVARPALWVAVLDDIHDTVVNSLQEQRLGRTEDGRKVLYQRLDLPWPAQDRQWVIEIWNNLALERDTNGAVWERPWDLGDPAQMPTPDDKALWLPMTNGSWLLLEVAGGTLMAYSARTTIGGAIPDELVTRWAMATLDEMMEHIVDRSKSIPAHYDRNHDPVLGGDNQPIKAFAKPSNNRAQ